jgi:hypothetical protein
MNDVLINHAPPVQYWVNLTEDGDQLTAWGTQAAAVEELIDYPQTLDAYTATMFWCRRRDGTTESGLTDLREAVAETLTEAADQERELRRFDQEIS